MDKVTYNCTKCKLPKTSDEFYWNFNWKHIRYRKTKCKACVSEYNRKYRELTRY